MNRDQARREERLTRHRCGGRVERLKAEDKTANRNFRTAVHILQPMTSTSRQARAYTSHKQDEPNLVLQAAHPTRQVGRIATLDSVVGQTDEVL
jgi:hypothetical protein